MTYLSGDWVSLSCGDLSKSVVCREWALSSHSKAAAIYRLPANRSEFWDREILDDSQLNSGSARSEYSEWRQSIDRLHPDVKEFRLPRERLDDDVRLSSRTSWVEFGTESVYQLILSERKDSSVHVQSDHSDNGYGEETHGVMHAWTETLVNTKLITVVTNFVLQSKF